MNEYMTLLGTEDVRHAGHEMGQAAQKMYEVAGYIEESLQRQRVFMDDWLLRFERCMGSKEPQR